MQKKYAGGIFLAQSGRKWNTFSVWPTGRTPWGEEFLRKKRSREKHSIWRKRRDSLRYEADSGSSAAITPSPKNNSLNCFLYGLFESKKYKKITAQMYCYFWRKRRDSNPRAGSLRQPHFECGSLRPL